MAEPPSFDPPSRDEDAVTYLPIDKQKESRIPFGPTDLRGAAATGGMRMGKTFPFVADAAMPPLAADKISESCDRIVRGAQAYSSILYLHRAQLRDVPALLEASQSYEIKTRWERLWVLSPFLSRLARRDEALEPLTAAFADDIAGLHLLSKFAEQKNPSVQKLFRRLQPSLLPALLKKLGDHVREPRRAALLCSIVATLETNETALREALPKALAPAVREELMGMLYHVPAKEAAKTLSSATLRERLETWRPPR